MNHLIGIIELFHSMILGELSGTGKRRLPTQK
jgi:hypothetical protein